MGSEYIHALSNLFLVLLLALALLFMFKKFRYSRQISKKLVNIIQVVSIGNKEKIVLIEANETFILLGATANHIETLHVFEQMPTAETLHDNKFALQLEKTTQLV